MTFKKYITFSLPAWIWERYFKNYKSNRSDFIIEMFMKGVLMETEQFKDNELKLIELIKKNRELENTISDLNHELELVKARVMTQEKRRIEKDNKIRERALIESQKRILRQADEEAYLKSLGK